MLEKFVEVVLKFKIGWHIDDFDDGKWISDSKLKKSSIDNVIHNYLNNDGKEAINTKSAKIIKVMNE